jgi:hypothetical protein
MSKNPKPTPVELKYVYDLIARGWDDVAIKEEYAHLDSIDQLEFPLRTDKRFFKDRRKEFESCKAILIDQVKKQVDPVTVKARQEHFEFLTNVVNTVLNGLNNVWEIYASEDKDHKHPIYAIMSFQQNCEPNDEMSLYELRQQIKDNLASAYEKFGHSQVTEYFLPHLLAENPKAELKILDSMTGDDILGIIETLKLLAQRKTFKGTCPAC